MQIFCSLIKLILIVTVTLLSAGCTALILNDLTGKKTTREIEISRSSDELIAIGTIGNKEVLKQFPEAIALVGKAQSYILLKGAKDLQALASLDGNLLKAADINGNELKPNLPLVFTTKDGEFFGTAWFIYKKKTTELSIAEKQTLSTIQTTHTMRSEFTRIGIRVSGIISEKEVTLSDAVTRFKAGRQIALIKTEEREEWVKYPNPVAIFMIPIAIVSDAVILPILIITAGLK